MRRLAITITLAVLLGVPAAGCKKKATFESCIAKCSSVGKESYDKCLLDEPKSLCDAADADGAASCRRTCEVAYGKPATSTEATSAAAPRRAFAGTEAGARELLSQFVGVGADHAALSKTLRPTADDYRALFDPETAAQIETAASAVWDSGDILIAPKPGQTEVKLSSATTEDLRQRTSAAKELPGGYAKVAPHLQPGVVLYRFAFVEPGQELGMAFDGLSHVNGHWVIVPKPWRMLGPSNDVAPAPSRAEAASSATGETAAAKGKSSLPQPSTTGSPQGAGRLPPEAIKRVIQANASRFRSCYERALSSQPDLKGRVTVKFVIGRAGEVVTAADGGSDLGSASVVACVVRTMASLRFPSPEGGTVTAVYPFVFQPAR